MSDTIFILYDGRSILGNRGDAVALDTAADEAEARWLGDTIWAGHDAVWWEGDECRYDLPPYCDNHDIYRIPEDL